MADAFSGGGKPNGPTEAEVKDLHAKIGRLAVENDFLSEGLKPLAGRQMNRPEFFGDHQLQ